MKVFIVFMGILLMAVSCLTYQGDVGRYAHDQALMKAMAEEVACGSGLCLDCEAYAMGKMVFDEDKALDYTRTFLKDNDKQMANTLLEPITFEITYEDDKPKNRYSAENKKHQPTIKIILTARIKDAFSLPFLKVEKITRKATYQIKSL